MAGAAERNCIGMALGKGRIHLKTKLGRLSLLTRPRFYHREATTALATHCHTHAAPVSEAAVDVVFCGVVSSTTSIAQRSHLLRAACCKALQSKLLRARLVASKR